MDRHSNKTPALRVLTASRMPAAEPAQFLDSGDGLVFRGQTVGPRHSEKTGDFHLNYKEAKELISSVVTSYKAPVR